jgi:hypothetical protein
MNIITLLQLLLDSGAVSPKAPTKSVGDYCEGQFGLPPDTVCVNNRVQPRLK